MPAAKDNAAAMIKQWSEAARKQAGNLRIEVLQGIHRPNQFVVAAVWKDQKALDDSAASDLTKDIREKLRPHAVAPRTIACTRALRSVPCRRRRHRRDICCDPCRCPAAVQGSLRSAPQAAGRGEPEGGRRGALRRVSADQPSEPFHRPRGLEGPGRRGCARCQRRLPKSSARSSDQCSARSTTIASSRRSTDRRRFPHFMRATIQRRSQ